MNKTIISLLIFTTLSLGFVLFYAFKYGQFYNEYKDLNLSGCKAIQEYKNVSQDIEKITETANKMLEKSEKRLNEIEKGNTGINFKALDNLHN